MSKPRTGSPRRVAVGLLAGALSVFGIALAPQAGATATVSTARLAGATRYSTSAAIAADATFTAPKRAIVATGENFPDALAASTIAGAYDPTPIILTERAAYNSETKAGLAGLKGKGVTQVTIVGGTEAVTQAVQDSIAGDGFTVNRVAGIDRYATAAEIAKAANAVQTGGSVGGLRTAIIATGENFPDALSGGPAAFASDLPLLLVTRDTVPAATTQVLTDLAIRRVIILGGTEAISTAVETQLVAQTGNAATRLAGVTRFGTATAIGDYEIGTLGFAASSVVLATGNNFPDALSSGPLGGQNRAPIILTSSLPPESQAFLDARSDRITKLFVAGGTEAIDDATVAAAQAAAQTVSNDTPTVAATTRPELIAASLGTTVTSGLGTGTIVRFKFDEAVTQASTVAALFHVVTSDGLRHNGSSATVVSGDATSVDVLFPNVESTGEAATLTVATVDAAATADAQSEENPEGDAPLGATSTTPLTAGITTAPDLQTVGNFRAAPLTTQTFIDFVFDEAANSTNTTGYHLVSLDGITDTTCTFNNGTGAQTHTVVCNNNLAATSTTTLSPANYARGYVLQDTVADSGGDSIPLESADISSDGNTGTPDIVSATYSAGTSTADFITVVFDQPVTNGSAVAGNFRGYLADSTEVTPSSATTSATTPNNVLLTFGDGTLATVVGVNARAGAVTAGSGANQGFGNLPDEVGVANSGTSTTSGRTSTPDLISVTKTAAVDAFGTATGGYNIDYAFDADVATATTANFFAYTADGTRYVATTCVARTIAAGGTEDTDHIVRCTAYNNAVTLVAAANTTVNTFIVGTVNDAAVTAETGGAANAAEGAERIV